VQNKYVIAFVCVFVLCFSAYAQDDKNEQKKDPYNLNAEDIVVETAIDTIPFDPLSPSKAAFYSAVLPGLGQAYNKKYWKIPIIYAALGTGIYFYIDNNKDYHRYRDAYKRRLAGFKDDEFYGVVTDDGLRNAQKQLNRNREISILAIIGVYALNIIDANVDAHLLQYNVDDNLSFEPYFKIEEYNAKSNMGLTLNFRF